MPTIPAELELIHVRKNRTSHFGVMLAKDIALVCGDGKLGSSVKPRGITADRNRNNFDLLPSCDRSTSPCYFP